jgi:hypothetical protein
MCGNGAEIFTNMNFTKDLHMGLATIWIWTVNEEEYCVEDHGLM